MTPMHPKLGEQCPIGAVPSRGGRQAHRSPLQLRLPASRLPQCRHFAPLACCLSEMDGCSHAATFRNGIVTPQRDASKGNDHDGPVPPHAPPIFAVMGTNGAPLRGHNPRRACAGSREIRHFHQRRRPNSDGHRGRSCWHAPLAYPRSWRVIDRRQKWSSHRPFRRQ